MSPYTEWVGDNNDESYLPTPRELIFWCIVFVGLLLICLVMQPCSCSVSIKSKPIEPATKAENGDGNAGE